MRSAKRPGLEEVRAQFEEWRARRRERTIPRSLWQAAADLVDRYAPTTVCRSLRLSPSRFKQMRGELGLAQRPTARERNALRGTHGRPSESGSRSSARDVGAADPDRSAFVELPPLASAQRSGASADSHLTGGSPAECRLVLDGAFGSRLTIILGRADHRLVGSVCRLVLRGDIVDDRTRA